MAVLKSTWHTKPYSSSSLCAETNPHLSSNLSSLKVCYNFNRRLDSGLLCANAVTFTDMTHKWIRFKLTDVNQQWLMPVNHFKLVISLNKQLSHHYWGILLLELTNLDTNFPLLGESQHSESRKVYVHTLLYRCDTPLHWSRIVKLLFGYVYSARTCAELDAYITI